MIKKILLIICITLIALTNNLNASTCPTCPGTGPYTTDSYGTQNTEFAPDETPYLYWKLPSSNISYILSWWTLEGTNTFYSKELLNTSGSDEIRLILDNWDSINPKEGNWIVNAFYSAPGENTSCATSFTVTPEPISSVLFISGGAVFVIKRSLKRRKKINLS
ncbi:MAG: hypothetical protein HY808_05620 [Nitrospirae bacterium]|nr:hypothetical protein [Nitrospirota bacterium]